MSDTDSFIDEVTEEVKRDRLFALMRRYGWIAVLLVLLIVGGTGWREYQKASAQSAAEQFGDAILAALEGAELGDRIAALDAVAAPNDTGRAILEMLIAAEEGAAGEDAAAISRLQSVSETADLPAIYRQIASFKALTRNGDGLSLEARRSGLEALAVPGQPLRLLAEEQLALLEIESGDREAARERLTQLAADAEATEGLRQRANQLIIALGGAPAES